MGGRGRGCGGWRRALAAVAALALAAGGACHEFPCHVQVKGRNRGDPECTRTVWRLPRAEARRLGLKRRTVFRSCPSRRARRRAQQAAASAAATGLVNGLPGGDDRVLSGFRQGAAPEGAGFLWSALTYDEEGEATMGVVRTAHATLLSASRPAAALSSPQTGRRQRAARKGARMTCRTSPDDLSLSIARADFDDAAPLPPLPEKSSFGPALAAATAEGTSGENCPLEAEDLRVSVLYEIDGDFVSGTFSGDLEKAKAHVQNLANLVSAQYALQAGVEVEGDVFIDTRADPHGHRYVAPTDRDQLREFWDRWNGNDSHLKEQVSGYALVHLISGKTFPQPSALGYAYRGMACSGLAAAVSWVGLLHDQPFDCMTSTMVHENGHTLGLPHDDDENSVMFPMQSTCTNTMTSSARQAVKRFVRDHVANSHETTGTTRGCSCMSGGPDPSLDFGPTAEAPEEAPGGEGGKCASVTRKKLCKRTTGCVFSRKAGCQDAPACPSIYRRRRCRRAGCSWTGTKRNGECA